MIQTKKNNETWILILGCTLMTAGICYWFYGAPILRQFFQIQKEIQQLESSLANQPKEIEEVQSETQQIQKQMETFKTEMIQAEVEAQKLLRSFQTIDAMETVVEVTKLFKQNNILLLESSFLDSLQSALMTESLKIKDLLKKPEIIQRYERQSNPDQKKAEHYFLKLEFLATFLDVTRLMKELSQLEIRVFPLGLRMEKMEGDKRNIHRWFMVLWL